eukprot:1824211-Rhodomonas_salina.1
MGEGGARAVSCAMHAVCERECERECECERALRVCVGGAHAGPLAPLSLYPSAGGTISVRLHTHMHTHSAPTHTHTHTHTHTRSAPSHTHTRCASVEGASTCRSKGGGGGKREREREREENRPHANLHGSDALEDAWDQIRLAQPQHDVLHLRKTSAQCPPRVSFRARAQRLQHCYSTPPPHHTTHPSSAQPSPLSLPLSLPPSLPLLCPFSGTTLGACACAQGGCVSG